MATELFLGGEEVREKERAVKNHKRNIKKRKRLRRC